ncbi:hypothetical protein LptCag_0717 [Leptospirillum ferriphilum]|uniref:Uncharacterized protein n=1 Tax=Leptospirillum ferriphilum TaxID=178606 RepID=A0A094YLK8_9BACT|nr:hypothetical protein LptCag_0717 [Leptospirillum ferriphilum]
MEQSDSPKKGISFRMQDFLIRRDDILLNGLFFVCDTCQKG